MTIASEWPLFVNYDMFSMAIRVHVLLFGMTWLVSYSYSCAPSEVSGIVLLHGCKIKSGRRPGNEANPFVGAPFPQHYLLLGGGQTWWG